MFIYCTCKMSQRVYKHMYTLATLDHRTTQCKLQRVQIYLHAVYKMCYIDTGQHHQYKLQEVMTPWGAGRALVLVDGKKIPPTQVAQGQDHLSICVQAGWSNQKQHGQGQHNDQGSYTLAKIVIKFNSSVNKPRSCQNYLATQDC